MWPTNGLGRVPTCAENGSHRYSAPHAIGKDRFNWLQKCRICGDSVILSFDEKNGEIVQKTYEIPSKRIVVS